MQHVAIDLGGRESQICIREQDGRVVDERRHRTRQLKGFLLSLPPSVVIVETSAEGFAVADAAIAAGHQVRVVPATLAPVLGIGQHGVKTDQRDARKLSEMSCRMELPSVHIPSEKARQRKTANGMREALVSARTQLVNTVRGWMRTQNRGVTSGGVETFPRRVRKQLEELPSWVQRQLDTIEMLNRQIAAADEELKADAQNDPLCQRLMTVPGVGPVTATRFVAAIDEVGRFESAHALESYLGLTPGEDSSSDRKRITSITKAGPARLRCALVQASWCARRIAKKDAMVEWSYAVEQRRGKRVATVALARKIAGVLYALWRDGTTYEAKRGALATAAAVESETQLEVTLEHLVRGVKRRSKRTT